MKSRIGLRLVMYIVLFSSCITLIGTAVQIYLEYRDDVKNIESYRALILTSYLQSLSSSVWQFDDEQIQIQLDGLVHLPDMEHLEIQSVEGNIWSAGTGQAEHLIKYEFPLTRLHAGTETTIGTLRVAFSLDRIYRRLIHKTLTILLNNGVKTFLVSGFTLFIFHFFVTRHLTQLAAWLHGLKDGVAAEEFRLRRTARKPGRTDELDEVAKAMNGMQAGMRNYLADLVKIDDELKNSNALLNAIIEGTTDAVFLKDLQGRYLMANQATCRAIGRPYREIIGKDDGELFAVESAAVISGVDASVIQAGATRLAEEKIATAYGEETYWLTSKSPYLDKDGKIIGLIGISRNITDIRKAEKEKEELRDRLRQAEKLEAIGTLAGGIAHDFNNILAAIIGYAELARDDFANRDRLLADLDEIMHGSLRAGELVRQILTFSRKGREELQPLQPVPVVREALRLMRASLPRTIALEEEIDAACGCIMADPTQIHQVLVNLCTNASHALRDEQGVIKIGLAPAYLPAAGPAQDNDAGPQRFVELTVSDTGHGMSRETVERIFEPYFTTKEVGKGSGMGLAVVHGIVQGCGGFINVESEPGKGSTFRVCFPVVAAGKTAESAEEQSVTTAGGSERILVIDDEESIVAVYERALTRLGYRVTAMTSSSDALALFLSGPGDFDLIVTDQTMSGLPGSELSEKIVRVRPDMPIILCTGYSSIMSEGKARQIGIKKFLMKPVSGSMLARVVREVLDAR